jgi:undecaprenyl phosphate N,N'-diacetylbacillosamine 1-phosphate transferase
MYQRYFKRIVDIIISSLALLVMIPFGILISVIIKLHDSGPVFYGQKRLGEDGRLIHIWKFRSMVNRSDRIPGEEGARLLLDHPEITPIGKWMRRYKIDELPQLINVIFGEMSLIGPRPSLPELANEFDEFGAKRIKVRPGCTGLAQIHGNINLPWPERWRYDAYYVDNISFSLDYHIMIRTLHTILSGEDIFILAFNEFQKSARK